MLENITFSYFAEQVVSHPALLIAVLLTLGVILVNGWTDAPNAIATCVSTRCIDVDKAIIMAGACNFLWGAYHVACQFKGSHDYQEHGEFRR